MTNGPYDSSGEPVYVSSDAAEVLVSLVNHLYGSGPHDSDDGCSSTGGIG
ncbi:MAG: hypothetical protein WC242_01060 [Candidatus Paceibacterota bacterium]|jgi:hypothetical protein